ncbi:MAG: uL13 family ribosomal protein, partial [Erysipelotrichaceae bacterium]|nr:uL13 family ribosomal protein [Clostridiales bacterium]MBR5755850.1 uL13 family ribosomal protein [Erysipelotrichaceae bacterium]
MATYVATKDSIERKWLVIDAEGMVLGRLATEVAKLLR